MRLRELTLKLGSRLEVHGILASIDNERICDLLTNKYYSYECYLSIFDSTRGYGNTVEKALENLAERLRGVSIQGSVLVKEKIIRVPPTLTAQ